jgi:hypothetical protein
LNLEYIFPPVGCVTFVLEDIYSNLLELIMGDTSWPADIDEDKNNSNISDDNFFFNRKIKCGFFVIYGLLIVRLSELYKGCSRILNTFNPDRISNCS